MTAALEGGEWSAARPGRTLPPGKIRYQLHRRLGGPQGRSGGKSRPHRDSILDRPARSQSLYRLSYPAHTSTTMDGKKGSKLLVNTGISSFSQTYLMLPCFELVLCVFSRWSSLCFTAKHGYVSKLLPLKYILNNSGLKNTRARIHAIPFIE